MNEALRSIGANVVTLATSTDLNSGSRNTVLSTENYVFHPDGSFEVDTNKDLPMIWKMKVGNTADQHEELLTMDRNYAGVWYWVFKADNGNAGVKSYSTNAFHLLMNPTAGWTWIQSEGTGGIDLNVATGVGSGPVRIGDGANNGVWTFQQNDYLKVNTNADVAYNEEFQTGKTAEQNIIWAFKDKAGVAQWTLYPKSTANGFVLYQNGMATPRLAFYTGASTEINSAPSALLKFNVSNGTGTVGAQFGDGAGNVKASIDQNGKGAFAGGVSPESGGNVKWTSGAGAPSGGCTTRFLYSNTSGTAGTILYLCTASAWVAKL